MNLCFAMMVTEMSLRFCFDVLLFFLFCFSVAVVAVAVAVVVVAVAVVVVAVAVAVAVAYDHFCRCDVFVRCVVGAVADAALLGS